MIKYIQFELSKGNSVPNYIDEGNLLIRRKKGVAITKDKFYGLGFMVEDFKGIDVVQHNGNTLGFTSDNVFSTWQEYGCNNAYQYGWSKCFDGSLKRAPF